MNTYNQDLCENYSCTIAAWFRPICSNSRSDHYCCLPVHMFMCRENTPSKDSLLTSHADVAADRDRLTDRPHYSVCNNRSYLRSTAMQPKRN